ncbi:TonB-dependent receptor plug domain-containing protein [Rhodocaloribacter litoris]|uniref:TonB-dependent receptor plug domain-containing protein n=1 Tax=Rhodocaloribacter litoris TaxID=2558931 RepID=UPI001420E8BC|nr:TonB-dependent receptor plug domain-containing protein [Rhodocaloribacter litoris]QXD15444.1 TonB-dependent receptor plug domain-containing protein [Rhodocaloribacter litoris]
MNDSGFVLPVLLLLLAGCGTAQPAAHRQDGDVNVGYGTEKEERLTTAVSVVTREQIEASSARRIEEVLRLAGVTVLRGPAGSYVVRIQGSVFPDGGNEPLFVIDGVPSPGPYSGVVAGLFPRDVERIEVLKDAAATAIYGSRGANGAILITTRSGH